MKNNFKFLIVLTILLAGCICIGSTFAADSNIDVTDVSVDNTQQNIEIAHDDSSTKDDEISNLQAGEGNFTELNNNIQGKTSYTLDKDYKFISGESFTDGIEISTPNFVLDGAGHTIDGSGLAGAFEITGNNVTIKNINFINNNASRSGSAIYWEATNGTVSGCNFTNTTAVSGGAICWDGVNGVVSGCTFINTTASNGYGGAILWYGDNGNVSGCSFTNCSASIDGGAIDWNDNYGTVSGCSFTNCSASNRGGAIDWCESDYGTVSGCTFTNTNALHHGGGAIFWSGADGVVSGCTFINTTSSKGNAIYIMLGSLNITSSSCDSTDDKAPIYNDDGTILSPVVITTMDGKTKKVANGEVVNVTGIVTTSGMRVAGRNLTFLINGNSFNATCDDTGLYSTMYTVDFEGTKLVDANYVGATGNQNVTKGKLTTENKLDVTVSVDDVTGILDDSKTVTVTVFDMEGNPVTDGVVSILWNGENQIRNVTNGIATFDLVLTNVGEYPVTAYYDGSATTTYNDGEGNFTVTVNKIPVTITIDPIKGKVGEKVKVTATLTDYYGNILHGEEVTFELNGKKYTALVNDGVATTYVTLPSNAGNYTLTAYFAGDKYYQEASGESIVEVTAKDIPGPNPDPNPKDVSNPVGNMENTGNPLLVLLIALCAIGLESFRRKF